jgi:hypothetical protein
MTDARGRLEAGLVAQRNDPETVSFFALKAAEAWLLLSAGHPPTGRRGDGRLELDARAKPPRSGVTISAWARPNAADPARGSAGSRPAPTVRTAGDVRTGSAGRARGRSYP